MEIRKSIPFTKHLHLLQKLQIPLYDTFHASAKEKRLFALFRMTLKTPKTILTSTTVHLDICVCMLQICISPVAMSRSCPEVFGSIITSNRSVWWHQATIACLHVYLFIDLW